MVFQGMTHFYFYIFHIDEYSNALLEDYVRTGEVELTYLLERNDRELLHWQMVAFRVSSSITSPHSNNFEILGLHTEQSVSFEMEFVR